MYLNCHSYFSLRYGTLSIEKLVETAKAYGVTTLALTDINNSTGMIDFVKACRENGIKPVAGIEFRRDEKLLYIAIARNTEGFRELKEFLTYHTLNGIALPDLAPAFENVVVIYPITQQFTNVRADRITGITPSFIRKLPTLPDKSILDHAVILFPVTFGNEKEYDLHCNLRAVDNNILLSRLRSEQLAVPYEKMIPEGEVKELFKDYPQMIRNTEPLLEECSID
jgi:DNA polymerase III alpha subunit